MDKNYYGIVYRTINIINGKSYIGRTCSSLKERKSQHFYDTYKLNKNRIINKAFRKYGWGNFKWEILEYCMNEEDLNEREIYYIKKYKTFIVEKEIIVSKYGYNMSEGGESNKGFKWDILSRKKITGEGNHRFGVKLSEKQKQNLKKKSLGRKNSKEAIENLKKSLKKHHWNRKEMDTNLIVDLFFEGNILKEITEKYNKIKGKNFSRSPFKRKLRNIGLILNAKNQNDYRVKQKKFIKTHKKEKFYQKA